MPQPTSSAVFWRRRLMVLALLIALVWIVVQLVPGGGDDPAPQAQRTTAQPTKGQPSATATTAASAEPTEDPVVVGTTPVTLTTARTQCDPELVRVTPSVRPKQLNRGAVDINLTFSTTAEEPCTLRPADAKLVAVISANDNPVWDSTVCKQSLLTQPVQLAVGWSTMTVVRWSGKGSGAACSSAEGWAGAGDYTIRVGTLGGEPGKAEFELDARPKPAKTVEPMKKPDAKKSGKPDPKKSAEPDDKKTERPEAERTAPSPED